MLMNEIEKLYANAEVKPFRYCYNCVDNNGNRIENSANCPSRHNCSNTCDIPEYEFTAEKQLKLIKWISQYCITIDCEDGEYEVYTVLDDDIIENFYDKLEDSIAHCVNRLWQDLTEEEKQQVKEILEGNGN